MKQADFEEFQKRCHDTVVVKSQRYHGTDDMLKTFRVNANQFSVPMTKILLVRMSEKIMRMSTMLDTINTDDIYDKQETLLDNAEDLANYTAFFWGAIREKNSAQII